MNRSILPVVLAAALLSVVACTASKLTVSNDLSTALDVASTLEAAYTARPDANPKVVGEMVQLLAAGRAALTSWEASDSAADQAAAGAAIAALVAYEASAMVSPKS